MPTIINGSDVITQLEVQMEAACAACGESLAVDGAALVPAAELRLRLLEDLGEIPLPLPECPACGGTLEPVRARSIYRPDEPELAALSCEAAREDGEVVSRFTLLAGGAPPAPITVTSEAGLAQAWGRPLSVRERLLDLLREVSSTPGERAEATLGPGMSAIAINFGRVPDPSDPDDQREVDALLTRHLPSADTSGIDVPLIVLASAYRGPGDVSEWAGHFADELRRGRLMLFGLIDNRLADDRLTAAAADQGAAPTAFALSELPETLRESRASLAERVWFSVGGDRFDLEPDAVGWAAAGRGQTLAEAAVIALGDRVALARRLGALVARLRERFPDDAVAAPVFTTVSVGDTGPTGRALVTNLEGLAARFTDDDELIDQIAAMRERFDLRQASCDCGEGWFIGQLRAPDDPQVASVGALITDRITDLRGQPFVLVATSECPHTIGYLQADSPDGLQHPDDLERRLADGPRRARLRMFGHLARGVDGRPVGAVLRGDRIATALAHPTLSGALAKTLGQRGLHGQLIAQAPTTDALIVSRPEEGALGVSEAAFMEARRAWGEVPGSPLGFVNALADPEPVGGRIVIMWADGANRAERRGRRR